MFLCACICNIFLFVIWQSPISFPDGLALVSSYLRRIQYGNFFILVDKLIVFFFKYCNRLKTQGAGGGQEPPLPHKVVVWHFYGYLSVFLSDRDECSSVRCAYRCRNTPGGYRCICPSGYNSTGYYCSGKSSVTLYGWPFCGAFSNRTCFV